MAKIAYFFSTFPQLTTTFLQREVLAVVNSGLDLLLTANRAPMPGNYHPQDEDFILQTCYLTSFGPVRYLMANLKWFAKHPRRYLNGVMLAFGLKDAFPWQRVKNLIHLAGAAVLAEHLLRNKVVHVHVHFAFGAASVAMFLKALTGIPYSLAIHGSDVLLPRPLTEEKLKRAKFVISNCLFHIRNLRTRFPSLTEQRFYHIRIGLDFRSSLWSRVRKASIDRKLRILNVARLEDVKAQEVLIRACVQLRAKGIPFHCIIVGEGPKRDELETLTAELDATGCIDLMGKQYENKVAELYEWSHVFVLSSLSEGTPMTIIEAMAKARPVIAPNITALPEMVTDNKTGLLFKKGSHEDLAGKLIWFAANHKSMERMGIEARKRAHKLFDLSSNTELLLSVFSREVPALRLNSRKEIHHE